jgi:thioredoxin reductase
VAVVGDTPAMAEFALGLLDWAGSVTLIRESGEAPRFTEAATDSLPVTHTRGRVVAIEGQQGQVRRLKTDTGHSVSCDVVFWLMHHEPQSDLAHQLGCRISDEGCVVVDDDCATSVSGIYAAGDMTPGPHLVQIAAAKGTRAGIAAACSLRGELGSPTSPTPAPVADETTVRDETPRTP